MSRVEAPHIAYASKIQTIVAGIGAIAIIDRIVDQQVWWVYREGVDPEAFKSRVCTGVGYYMMLFGMPGALQPSCGTPVDWEKLSVVDGITGALEGLDEDGRIVQSVSGLTGTPPTWGNVIRITAEQLMLEEAKGLLK